MEFGTQCFCGTAIMNNAASVPASQCNIACPADGLQVCSGSNALRLYVVVPIWQSLGCYSDSTKARTLAVSYDIAGNTVEKCQAGGYLYAGMEFGTQCFCGNPIDNGGVLTSGCATPCAGDSTEVCGGSKALSMYYLFQ
ncbi:putative fungistatic metabolite [Aspergillus lentulus]|nr:hypothetical protein CNMCM6069_005442 [Aspergillus lentulus]GFG01735.1 putative fungistatic metabolite [Aspergillus lentulus]